MAVTIKIIRNEFTGVRSKLDGTYIQEYFPDLDPEGRGSLIVTRDRDKAKHFQSFTEASEFWKQQSKRNPLRKDGKPNRPLTAFSVEIK